MSGTIQNNLITVRQGDSFTLDLLIKEKGQPLNLSGAGILMQVREKDGGNLLFEVSGTAVDAINGKTALLITPTETSNNVGDYVCDIQLTTAGGDVHTIWPANVNQIGTFRITEQVTQ